MSTDARPFGAFVLFVGGALLVLAVQTLPARLVALPGEGLRDKVLDDASFSDSDFSTFVSARAHSVSLRPTAEYLEELAAATTARATEAGASQDEADRFFNQATADQTAALQLEPADSYGWSQMAFLDMQKPNTLPKAASELRLSIATAPYEPGLMPSRLDMMMSLHDYLTPAEQQQIPAVARAAFDVDPQSVASEAQSHNYANTIEDALANDGDALKKFQALLPPPPAPADTAAPAPADTATPATP
jgi:hypothetical protein